MGANGVARVRKRGLAPKVPVPFWADQEGKAYVAHCPELDVSSCGHDVEEARRNRKTAVRLFVEESEKLGTP